MSGPDHLAALAPLAGSRTKNAWAMGMQWGLGHATGVLFIGILSLAFRHILPIDLISGWSERLVGIVLIVIGVWGLRKALTRRLHVHEHTHDGQSHVHAHFHDRKSGHHPSKGEKQPHKHRHTAVAVGWLHGMAGGSHLLAIIPALAFGSHLEAGLYLASYGVGTIAAMIAFCSLVGIMARRCSFSGSRAYSIFLVLCSIFAIGIGGYWLVA
jgi:sulfite exporter TauE/SafE